MKKLTSDPLLPLSEIDKREFCAVHGWVGKKRFQHERHDLCEAPEDTRESVDAVDDETDDGIDDTTDATTVDDVIADEDADASPDAEEPRRWSRASARRQGIPPKKTLAVRRITQLELAVGRAELAALGADEPYERPKTRSDCAQVPRPCPYVACKHNLYLDVSETGSIILNFPHLEPGQMVPEQSCAVDLAERGAMTLEDIAVVTNLTRERIRQIELKALIRKARPAAVAMGLGSDDAAALGTRHHVGPGADLEETGIEGAVPSDVATLLSGGGGGDDDS